MEYELFLNSSILPIVGDLTGTTTLDQSGPGSNGNEGVLQTSQISRTEASPPTRCILIPFTGHFLLGVLSICILADEEDSVYAMIIIY